MVSSALKTLDALCQQGVFAVIRTSTADDALWLAEVLHDAGLGVIEITWTVPEAATVLHTLAERHPTLLFGAGTILTQADADAARAAGACFMASPGTDTARIRWANTQDVLWLPGCLTPTEIMTATQSGAPAIKWFPASLGGPAALKMIRGPLGHIPMICTGGIHWQEAATYLQAGAAAVGLGGTLASDAEISARDAAPITRRVTDCLEAVRTVLAAKCPQVST